VQVTAPLGVEVTAPLGVQVSAPLGVEAKMKFPSERGARRAGWELINTYFYDRAYLQLQCLSHPVTLRVPPLSEGNEEITPRHAPRVTPLQGE